MVKIPYIVIWIICGVVAGYIYKQRGRSQGIGFFGGVLLGPIGIILAVITPTQLIKCPHCAERIQPDAKICRYCGKEIPEELQQKEKTITWSGPLIFGAIILVVVLLLILGPILRHLF
ncbi:MAG: hypothetical protein B6I38_09665 [Anaerolineaceae bacterium 4572_5.1]|nr:MAG: hypothetical protein B5M51_08615 [Anaerolinea sp. 4484_236]OQY27856.1 MAG: hypothetical protein B6I38_09665 [Anaerolineaceae bacterium 4572_5.1]RLD06841.1 MAG: hypothetical protein DRI56_07495 [Chloroflexota bacterium]